MKQPKVALVTADGAAETHFLTQGRFPGPQGHLGTAHLNRAAQSVSPKHVFRSQFFVAHSHFGLHAAASHVSESNEDPSDNPGHLLMKQPKVAFVTADGAAETHFLTHGMLPGPQGHLGTAHANVAAQSLSPKHVFTSHFVVAHSHFSLHADL